MNEELAEFFRKKIRAKIVDPAVADLLIPRGYPILTKRLCADTDYYETYNRDNVRLVDISRTPINRLVAAGVEVGETVYSFDDVIFALGFDAVTGAIVRVDIRGLEGISLAEAWREGPRTNAGLMTRGFPNLLFVNGPGSCTGFFNPVLNVEYQGNWFAALLTHMKQHGLETVDSTASADEAWVEKMAGIARPTLFWNSSNWYTGSNIPGKTQVMQLYLGGFTSYRDHTTQVAASGYTGFEFA
jgi:cyclohexanone monooxygenase